MTESQLHQDLLKKRVVKSNALIHNTLMSEEQHLEEDLSKESPNKDNTNDEEKKEPTHSEKPTKPEEEKQQVKSKVDILLKATGDTPIMKTKKWAVESDRTVGSIIEFIKKYLKLEVSDSLFLYVNQSFAPSPDQIISNLFECFGSDGKLVLHYCKTPAWG